MRAGRGRHPRLVQRVQRGDPRRDRRGEGLAEERAEGDVLPGLDVPRRPVVEQAQPEDVVAEVGQRDRACPAARACRRRSRPPPRCRAARRGRRRVRGRWAPCAAPRAVRPPCRTPRPCPRGRGNRSAGASSWGSGSRPRPGGRSAPTFRRVVLGGVEVDVVRDLEGQVQRHRGQRVQKRGRRPPGGPGPSPTRSARAARRDQAVRPAASSGFRVGRGEQRGVRGAEGAGRGARVEHVVAEPDADASARAPGGEKTP